MGAGYSYRCSKCGEEYSVHLGAGMLFPSAYERLVNEIKEGVYGEEWKTLFEGNDMTAVDAEISLYYCSECNSWKNENGLSLYIPKDPESIRKRYESIGEADGPRYVMRHELQEDYRLLKEYIHTCDKCGGKMHEATQEEIDNLPCPSCG